MNRFYLLAAFTISYTLASAQSYKLSGKVTNAKLEPLAFVSIQLKDRQQGAITKEDGSYEIMLEEEVYELVVTMVGYKSQVLPIVLHKASHQQHIILEADDTQLDEVVIKGKAKDRSEEIIRQVIRQKEAIQQAAGAYSCRMYIKAVQEDTAQQKNKKRKVSKDTSTQAQTALQRMAMTEISLRYDYDGGNRIKEERLGVERKGDASDLFYLSATEGRFDFYDNLVKVPSISATPFLSPVSYSGLVAYRYKMKKIEQVGKHKLYTITIKPGKLSNATVDGEITITDSGWAVVHTRFSFPAYHLATYDFFEVEQHYTVVNNTAWMITRQQFTYYAKTNRSQKSGTTTVSSYDFVLNKTFPPKYFGVELSSAAAAAYERDSSFWQQQRTEPLTAKEIKFIRYKDSVYNATHTKEYLDSVDRLTNKVTWKKILFTGQPIYNREKERLWQLQPLVTFIQPIQFGGMRIQPSVFYSKTYASKKSINLFADLSYGIRNKDLNGNIHLQKMYNPFNRGGYTVSLQRDFQYIFQGDAWINMLKRSNMFLDNGVGLGHGIELFNGFFLHTSVDIAFRRSLSDYKTNNTIDTLLGNVYNEFLKDNEAVSFDSYNAAYGKLELRYTPRQRYIREPKEKIILGSAWPTFYVQWRKGVPGVMKSKVDFDYLELGMQQTLKMGLVGTASYTVRSGEFLNRKDLRLVDYKFQRRGDPLLLLNPNEAFQALDSTFAVFRRYYEGHYVHEFNGALLNKIPLLKKIGLREVAGGGFLFAPERNLRYAEAFAGVERVFKAPFNIPTKFKMGVYVVGAVANQFRNPVQFKIGFTTWDKRRGRWF